MRIPLFLQLFWQRVKRPRNYGTISILLLMQFLQFAIREVWDTVKSFIFESVVGQQARIIMENPLIFWPTFVIFLILIWIIFQTKKNYWEDFAERVENLLDDMHERVMEIEKSREQTPITETQLHNVIILVADDLDIVKANKWPELIDTFKKRLGLEADMLPIETQEVERIAREMKHSSKYLKIGRKNYTLEDAKHLGGCMDAEHIGIGEIRKEDKIWNEYYEELLLLQRSYNDERLDRAIERHIEYSYVVASFTLWKYYAKQWESDVYLHYFYAEFTAKSIDFERRAKYRVNELIKQVIARIFNMKYLNTEYIKKQRDKRNKRRKKVR